MIIWKNNTLIVPNLSPKISLFKHPGKDRLLDLC